MNKISREKRLKVEERRSGHAVRIALLILGLAGMGISGYLTYVHYRDINAICLFGAKCDKVLTSVYAQMWGVPLALFGLLMYAGLTILGALNIFNRIGRQDLVATGIYDMALTGTLFSLYLYYLEIFEIHAFCTWCIGSSIVMFSIFILSIFNLKVAGFKSREFRRWLSQYVQW
jgi:uncharacterized membrane protein